jgi:hypothetical protein
MLSLRKNDLVNLPRLKYLSLFPHAFDKGISPDGVRAYINKAVAVKGEVAAVPVGYDNAATGRLQAKGASMQYFNKNVRAWLSPPGAVDLDIANSAPTIIYQVGLKHGAAMHYLKDFLDNYQDRLAQFGEDADMAKVKGRIMFTHPDDPISRDPAITGWLNPLRAEIGGLYQLASSLPEYRRINDMVNDAIDKEKIDSSKRKSKKRDVEGEEKEAEQDEPAKNSNRQGKFMSRLYFHYESLLVGEMIKALDESQVDVRAVSLVYDGMIVYPRSPNVLEELMEKLETSVKDATGFAIKLRSKPMETDIKVDINKLPDESVITGGDNQAADIMVFKMRDDIKRITAGSLVARGHNGLWIGNGKKGSDNPAMGIIRSVIGPMNMKKMSSEGKNVVYSANYTSQVSISNCMLHKLEQDEGFLKRLVLGTQRKLQFKDGYYEFMPGLNEETGVYGRFVPDGRFDSGVMIGRRFPVRVQENVDFVMDKVLKPIFLNTEPQLLETFLSDLSRGVAGHTDKSTILMVGERNCGKSIINQFLRASLGAYTCIVPAGVLTFRGAGDGYLENKWILDTEHARVAIISEGKETDSTSGVRFSSETIKQFQSLKEGVMTRGLHSDQREVCSLATIFMMLNEVPKMDAEAIKMFRMYSMSTKFVSREEKESSPFNTEFQLRNPAVDNWSQSDEYSHYQDAFFHILLDHYTPEQKPPLPSMIATIEDILEDDQIIEAITNCLIITGDVEDVVPQKKVRDVMKLAYSAVANRSREFNQVLFGMIRKYMIKDSIPARGPLVDKSKFTKYTKRFDGVKHKAYAGIRLVNEY